MVEGEELLIVESSERTRSGLSDIFTKDGFIVTALPNTRSARERLVEKFFPVMLADFDAKPEGGIKLLKFCRERSPSTAVVMLSAKKSFNHAVEAFRLGAFDVIPKDTSELERMREQVVQASQVTFSDSEESVVMTEVLAIMEHAVQLMMDLYGNQPEIQRKIKSLTSCDPILLAESDQGVAELIIKTGEARGLSFEHVPAGGAALDVSMQTPVSIALLRDQLQDLSGSMTAKSIQANSPSTMVVVYTHPGPGRFAETYSNGSPDEVLRPLDSADDLIKHLEALLYRSKDIEAQRRIIEYFSSENSDFLKRYAGIKKRIQKILKK